MQRSKAEMLCVSHGVKSLPPEPGSKVGIALHTLHLLPLNGVRHAAELGTCGWYIWGGSELSDDISFFSALHVEHLRERCPAVLPYLHLPPGWRFLVAPGHEDVWEDPEVSTRSLGDAGGEER